ISLDIFESNTNGFSSALFMFANPPSHQRWAGDALSARKMPKRPNEGWTHRKDGHIERMDTSKGWTHRKDGHIERMDTSKGWTHRKDGHIERMDPTCAT